VRPLGAEFEWSRGEISGGVTALMIGTIVVSPVVGRLIDRFGSRSVAMWSQAGLSLGFVLLSLVTSNIITFYAAWLAFSFLAAGTSPIAWARAVAGWFDRSRGLSLGIMLCGTGITALVAPILVNQAIASFGWRIAYRILAATVLASIPITFLLLRSREPVQQAVSGGAADGSLSSSVNLTTRDALCSSQFWRVEFAIFLISIVVAGLIVHMPSMLVDRGLTAANAAGLVANLGYAIIIGRLALGYLLDRMPPATVAAVFVLFSGISSLLLASNLSPLAAVLLLGLCAGAEVDMLAFLMSRLFGLGNFAQIYGFGISAFTAGAALGPIIAGLFHDHTGGYGDAFYLFAAFAVIASGLVASLGPALRATRDKQHPAHR
jgi:MFS family permease